MAIIKSGHSFFFGVVVQLKFQVTFTGLAFVLQSTAPSLEDNQQPQLQNPAYQLEHGSFGRPEFDEVMQ